MRTGTKKYSYEEVVSKMMSYCSFQERSKREVTTKAYQLGLKKEKIEELLHRLEEENFINEKRFVQAYLQGKVNVKRWGPFKLMEGLFNKGIESEMASAEISQIEESVLNENLNYWIARKTKSLGEEDKQRLYRFLLGKGYASEHILKFINKKP